MLAAEENQTYYPLKQYVGNDFAERIFIPSILETDLAPLNVSQDFGEEDEKA